MATFRNDSPNTIIVNLFGATPEPITVPSGEEFDLPDEFAYAPKLVGLPVSLVEQPVSDLPVKAKKGGRQ